jgi:ankyrin repeat protein
MARLLLEKGADPNLVAGNGLTALDLAEARGAAALAAALAVRGGKRAEEL